MPASQLPSLNGCVDDVGAPGLCWRLGRSSLPLVAGSRKRGKKWVGLDSAMIQHSL